MIQNAIDICNFDASWGAGVTNGLAGEVTLPWRDPFFYKLIANQRPFRNGTYELSDPPGFGWEYDADYLTSVIVTRDLRKSRPSAGTSDARRHILFSVRRWSDRVANGRIALSPRHV